MAKNWSKIVLVSLLVVVFGASLAYASTSRVRSLANTGDYLSDDSNVFRWYSTLPSYANMIQAELGHWRGADSDYLPGDSDGAGPLWSTRGLSINHACGEDGKYGTYRFSLIENTIDSPGFHSVNTLMSAFTPSAMTMMMEGEINIPDPYHETPVNKWDIAGGWDINENVSAGVSLTRSSWKWETVADDPPTDWSDPEQSASYTTIGVGGSWSNNEDFIFDAAFTYGFAGGEYKNVGGESDSTFEWDSKNAIDIALRGFWDWKDDVTVIPVFEYASANYNITRAATDYAPDTQYALGDKISMFGAGVGLDMEVNGDNTIIFAVEFAQMKWEPSNPDTTQEEYKMTVLPTLRLALESEINSWLTTRIGAVHTNYRTTATNVTGSELKYTNGAEIPAYIIGEDGDTNSHFEWFLGAGFNIAEWTIDMELAPETPFSLGYWLTGYSTWEDERGSSSGPVWRISGIYNF
jgi:hypothetical protein